MERKTPETFEVPMDHPQASQGELDRIWNDIRSTLASTAMKNMTIPQARVFSAEATLYIGGHVRKLVDVELAAHTAASQADQVELLERLLQEDTDFGGSLHSRIRAELSVAQDELAALRKGAK
jgi:hypothetical protein